RDGREPEVRLIYSGADFGLWRTLLSDQDEATLAISIEKLNDMYGYCTAVTCRHQLLLDYFGEALDKDNCGACDLCLGNAELLKDAHVIAQKIASCVARLGEVAGPSYTTLVLTGSREARVGEKGHDKLSTWGLLQEYPGPVIRTWIEQLVSQDYLCKTGEYNILGITPRGREMLKGGENPRLLKPAVAKRTQRRQSAAAAKSWEGVDKALFNLLRSLRREIALEHTVPAFTVFGDAALRDMARRKPLDEVAFLQVSGVGEKKCADYACLFLPVIQEHVDGSEEA
ncbi:MAG: HRDC domain-containing protein, partial [Candidatus Hydrogenedentes bacterium]|nr:HRDC domain-containing protein [Candidatus Hydrogenedentota bacterium]